VPVFKAGDTSSANQVDDDDDWESVESVKSEEEEEIKKQDKVEIKLMADFQSKLKTKPSPI
jgi:hypothetical protein